MTTIDGTATTDTAQRLNEAAHHLRKVLDIYADGPLTSAEAGPIRLGCVELLEALGAHQQATLPIDSVPADRPAPGPRVFSLHEVESVEVADLTVGRKVIHTAKGGYIVGGTIKALGDMDGPSRPVTIDYPAGRYTYPFRALCCLIEDDDHPGPEPGVVLRAAHRVQPGDVVQRVCGDPLWHTVAHVEPFHQQAGRVLERGVAIECEDCPLGEFPRDARLRVRIDGQPDDGPVANPAGPGRRHASAEDVTVALGCGPTDAYDDEPPPGSDELLGDERYGEAAIATVANREGGAA